MRTKHGLIVTLCIVIPAVLGCNSPASVDSNNTAPASAFYAEPVACPSVEAMAQAIVNELNVNCPMSREYRHWGEQNSCEKRNIGQMLEAYEGCYNEEELKEIRLRIDEMRHAQASDDTGVDEPKPMQM
jgi:hypothetical protein